MTTETNLQVQAEALGWLFEMELINTPSVLNSIILNLLAGVLGVKDAELVVDLHKRQILVFLELTWWARRFKVRRISTQVNDIINDILPSFEKRVTFDRVILDKALKIVNT